MCFVLVSNEQLLVCLLLFCAGIPRQKDQMGLKLCLIFNHGANDDTNQDHSF